MLGNPSTPALQKDGALQNFNPVLAGSQVRLTVVHPNCVRIEYHPEGKFVDEPSLFAIKRETRHPFKLASDQDGITLDTGKIKLNYRLDGRPPGPANLSATIRDRRRRITWRPGMRNQNNLGGTAETLDMWDGPGSLGEGLLSRDGWYLLDDSNAPLLVDGWVRSREAGAGTDWYLFGYGNDYAAAFQAFAAISGPVPMPRRHTLGSWYSRFWPYSSGDFRQIVAEYEKMNFPLDIMVMDMDWHMTSLKEPEKDSPHSVQMTKLLWTGFSWNRNLLPDAESLLTWFGSQNLHVTLNDHPAEGVQPHEVMYDSFMSAMGAEPKSGETLPFDAGDRRYLEPFYNHTHSNLEKIGVDFWWLDWQQYPFTRSVSDLKNLSWLNYYYHLRSRDDGRRGQTFSRWGGWGDHRHPIHFSGDANTSWKMLAFEIPFTSTSGNVGCFFWSHDIGGHMGGRNEESYTRWCQFGALSTALRSHSTRDADMDRRPWTYPDWANESMRRSFHLRSEIFPYVYSSVAQSCRHTIPLIRPTYLKYPEIEEAYRNPQQYFFGDHLLVAPVAEPGTGARRLARQVVWFPPGSWFHYFTGEQFTGPCERLVPAEIDEFPLFVEGGSPLAMQPYTPRMGTEPLRHLVVRCWPGEENATTTTELYEDEGKSDGYSRGEQARTNLSYTRRGSIITITVSPTTGAFKGQLEERACTVELPVTELPCHATLDGKPVDATYDKESWTTRIHVPPRSIRKGFEVIVNAAETDQALVKAKAFARRAGLETDAMEAVTGSELMKRVLAGGSQEKIDLALRAAGIGLVFKNENVYGHPNTPECFFYAPPSWGVSPRVSLENPASAGAVQTYEIHGEKLQIAPKSVISLIPPPENELLIPDLHVRLMARFSLQGQEIQGTQPIVVEQPIWSFQKNLAPRAKATASSFGPRQPPSAAIDGVVDGYPRQFSREWASNQEGAGAWFKLEWPRPVEVGRILLFDRPNPNDHIAAGRLILSDGTVFDVLELPGDGTTPFELRFTPRKIRWLTLMVTKVSELTRLVGLSEIAVFSH